jgi:alanyl-tRNA synthetase
MADCETEDALEHSFLAELPAEVISELRVGGVIATAADRIVILDATRLYAESGGSAGL